jgi:hypothetical protein
LKKIILVLVFICACSARENPETVVLRSTWGYCVKKCGKGETAAVSNSACVCANGAVIPFQPQALDPVIPEQSLFDKISAFLRGDGKS